MDGFEVGRVIVVWSGRTCSVTAGGGNGTPTWPISSLAIGFSATCFATLKDPSGKLGSAC